MNKRDLVAPCGIDCFNCDDYITNIDEATRIEKNERLGIPLEETGCRGCKIEDGRCRFNVGCETLECVKLKGVTYCFECAEFPCTKFIPTEKASLFPHNMKMYNLGRIKLIGVDAWIEETPNIRELYYDGEFVVGKGPVLK